LHGDERLNGQNLRVREKQVERTPSIHETLPRAAKESETSFGRTALPTMKHAPPWRAASGAVEVAVSAHHKVNAGDKRTCERSRNEGNNSESASEHVELD